MKIILTGTSGFIGTEVLRQCLQHPSITSIIALSRRDLSVAPHPKLQTVLVKDFENYEPSVLAALEGAEGCIWSLGVKNSDVDIQKKVTIDYTLAALRAFSTIKPVAAPSTSTSPSSPSPSPFRFIFTSGILAVRSPSEKLWFGSGARHLKGRGETEVLDFADESRSDSTSKSESTTMTDSQRNSSSSSRRPFDAFVLRPGAVIDAEASNLGAVMAGVAGAVGVPAVSVQALAAVMVELAVNGGGNGSGGGGGVERVWENKALVVRGKDLLAKAKAKSEAKGKGGEL